MKVDEAPPPGGSLAGRWLKLIESVIEPIRMSAGLAYARSGQIVTIEILPGSIESQVQGTAPRPYSTQLQLSTFTAEQWDRLIDAMAVEAVYAAKMLAGEIPPAFDDLLATFDLTLLPHSISVRCSCADAQPCKHAAAAGYIVAERLAENPLLVLTIRGMSAERVLERLRRARTIQAHGVTSAHADPLIPESQVQPHPLEACIDEFWRNGPELAELENRPPPHHAPHALLRRLGPSPMSGRFPMVGLLASVYDTVSESIKRLRDEAELNDEPRQSDLRENDST